MIPLLIGAASLLMVAGTLVFLHAAAPPCSCPVAFSQWMIGERCAKHQETTEVARRETGR